MAGDVQSMIRMIRMIDSDTFYLYGNNYGFTPESRGIPSSSIPKYPKITNLDSLLHDLYLRYIALNDEDFETYYNIVNDIFLQMHKKMKQVDQYYAKYASTVQFVGSHPDHLRINKPDEFDIDIAINMPLSFRTHPHNPELSDFLIQPSDPGFLQLKMGKQYQNLPKRDPDDWSINSKAYRWRDEENYLLRSKFLDWFKSVVTRALSQFVRGWDAYPTFFVNGVPYTVRRSESGPAMTMYIENKSLGIKLDLDLVVCLRFPIERWPPGAKYRKLPAACVQKRYWMLVPKLNKAGATREDMERSWRLAMHEQERVLMYDTYNLRQAIRLMKKLRDAQYMDKISSYYIKTIFFWEVARRKNDKTFWMKSPAFLFKYMLERLYGCLITGYIPYFWNARNNLIADVDRTTINRYRRIVGDLLAVLDEPSQYMEVTRYLLDSYEYKEYRELLRVSPVTRAFNFISSLYLFLLKCVVYFIVLVVFIDALSKSSVQK
ncbi:mab-21 protein domain-containing protein [Phthorimaea operculella]|nr:mab-21 protein domain-containing protein [Phthorimaea operculella]